MQGVSSPIQVELLSSQVSSLRMHQTRCTHLEQVLTLLVRTRSSVSLRTSRSRTCRSQRRSARDSGREGECTYLVSELISLVLGPRTLLSDPRVSRCSRALGLALSAACSPPVSSALANSLSCPAHSLSSLLEVPWCCPSATKVSLLLILPSLA